MNSDDRQNLRKYYRNARNQLSEIQQHEYAKDCLQRCLESNLLQGVSIVACYLANDGELDPSSIVEFCWQQSIRVLLPVIDPKRAGHLRFVEYHPNSMMQQNKFAIAEPVATPDNTYGVEEIELIFAPLVAFDSKGNRLGMGGGFYDRTLVPIHQQRLKTKLVGLAHDCQQAKKIPIDSWDIPLDLIVTPTRSFKIKT